MAYYTAEHLKTALREVSTEVEPGRFHPSRPINYQFDTVCHRFWLAWQVFTGKMDALKWYRQ